MLSQLLLQCTSSSNEREKLIPRWQIIASLFTFRSTQDTDDPPSVLFITSWDSSSFLPLNVITRMIMRAHFPPSGTSTSCLLLWSACPTSTSWKHLFNESRLPQDLTCRLLSWCLTCAVNWFSRGFQTGTCCTVDFQMNGRDVCVI